MTPKVSPHQVLCPYLCLSAGVGRVLHVGSEQSLQLCPGLSRPVSTNYRQKLAAIKSQCCMIILVAQYQLTVVPWQSNIILHIKQI